MSLTNYIFIDFENVQNHNFEILKTFNIKLFIFIGQNQNKIPFNIVNLIHSFGNSAEYIKISGSGLNALDFHISYYIGKYSSEDSKSNFYIISKDTGFDPLICHLTDKKIKIFRVESISNLGFLKNKPIFSIKDNIDIAIGGLKQKAIGRPKNERSMINYLDSLFKRKLTNEELILIVKELQKTNKIKIDNSTISYNLK